MNGLLDDIVVARKLAEILDILYGEGTKAQVEKLLVSNVEDELEEASGQALDDGQYALQRHRVRDAMIESGILLYDTKTYRFARSGEGQAASIDYGKLQQAIDRQKALQDTEKKAQQGAGGQKEPPRPEGGHPPESNGAEPRFDLASQEEEFKSYVLHQIREMKPFEFERLTTKLLRACGLEFYPGNRVGDDGVDGYGYLEVAGLFKFKVLVQCKRYKEDTKIQNSAIRDLRGAVSTDAYKGLFVTTSSFTPRAKQEAEKFPQIDMIDGRQFVDLMIEKRVGISEADGKYFMEKGYLEHITL